MRFDGKVVIVTGAGAGLGKCYALDFAKLGAKVVVNDLGGKKDGQGNDGKVADAVVAEIKAKGGDAIANYNSVTDGAAIVKTAIDKWGRVDIIINNAGILRDGAFHKMTEQDYDLIMAVHLKGTYNVTRAAWPYMREQNYGRIVFVTSAAGLYGNFGQANYSAAKLGIVGLSNTLANEGKKNNIKCNTIAPLAASRMTEGIMPPQMLQALKPECVSPLVQYLSHDSCTESGGIFEVGAGWIARVRYQRSKGVAIPLESLTADRIAEQIKAISDFSKEPSYPVSPQDSIMAAVQAFQKAKL
jgi:3-hydroxyacyl-CoA dehydrogenase/3a,7a,12a-trihydroxy-5b-cholest-24-enoyl-CoA hydratase